MFGAGNPETAGRAEHTADTLLEICQKVSLSDNHLPHIVAGWKLTGGETEPVVTDALSARRRTCFQLAKLAEENGINGGDLISSYAIWQLWATWYHQLNRDSGDPRQEAMGTTFMVELGTICDELGREEVSHG